MLYQSVGVNVGSKTMNMVGGGGINSSHPPTSRYQQCAAHGCTGQSGAPMVRHRCANGRLQRLVLTASRWADGTPDSEQSLSGAPLKFHSGTLRSRVSVWGNPSHGPAWPHLAKGAPDSPVPQGQKPYFLFYAVFQIGFRSNLSVCSRVSPSTICECECAPTLH
jgi:hypothetical protein